MWFGLLILLGFLLIPVAIIVIPAWLTKRENDLNFSRGSMTRSSVVVRFVTTLVCTIFSMLTFSTELWMLSTYSVLLTICIYCVVTVNGSPDQFYNEETKLYSQILVVLSLFLLGLSTILLLNFSFSSPPPEPKTLSAFSAPVLIAYSFIYKNWNSLMKWLSWLFVRRN